MLVQTRGVVLHRMKYSETSLICKIYTEQLGLKTYLVKGARRPKSRQAANMLQSMNLLDMVVYNRQSKSMQTIKEMRPALLYNEIPFNTVKGSVGLFMMEILSKSIREEEENPALFDFIYRALDYLDSTDLTIANFPIFFMLKLSQYLGIEPFNNFDAKNVYFNIESGQFEPALSTFPMTIDEGPSALISALHKAMTFEEVVDLDISKSARDQALQVLLRYYEFHIESFKHLKSLRVLRAVLSDWA